MNRTFGHTTRLPSGSVRAGYSHRGNRHNQTFAPADHGGNEGAEAAAFEWLEERRALLDELATEAPGGSSTPPAKARAATTGRTVREAYASYLTFNREKPLAPLSLVRYNQLWRNHIEGTFGDRRLGDVSAEEAGDWFEGLNQLPPSIRAGAYRVLFSIFRHAARERGWLAQSPVDIKNGGRFSPSRAKQAPREEVLAEVVKAAEQEDAGTALLIKVMVGLGVRVGEACALRKESVQFDRGRVWLMIDGSVMTEPGGGRVRMAPKTRRSVRRLPVPEWLATELVTVALATEPGAPLVPSKEGGWPRYRPVAKALERASKAAGLTEKLRCHDARRACLTNHSRAGFAVADLQLLAGHSNPATTLTYLVADDTALIEMADRDFGFGKAADGQESAA